VMHFEQKKVNRQTGWHLGKHNLNNSCNCDRVVVTELSSDQRIYDNSDKKMVGLLRVVLPNQVLLDRL